MCTFNSHSLPHIMHAMLHCTPARALLLLEMQSVLISKLFSAVKSEMALFWQILSNKRLNLKGNSTCYEGKISKIICFARCAYVWLMQTAAVCYWQKQIVTLVQECERPPGTYMLSTRKHGCYLVFSLHCAGHGMPS